MGRPLRQRPDESHGDVVAKLLAVGNDEPPRVARRSGGEEEPEVKAAQLEKEEPEVKAARLEKQAERMRQVKLRYQKDSAEIALQDTKDESKDDLIDLATVAGVHVAPGKRRRDKPSSLAQTQAHARSFSLFWC